MTENVIKWYDVGLNVKTDRDLIRDLYLGKVGVNHARSIYSKFLNIS